ncbi:hypothetical protein [Ostreibacterium oceani]|uniref:DUF4760 domain-containing protein n=1 Tax=Ostreibacterium oceani TaxID=2654998 RepID=A0A6N7EWP8_9GAMM|nr:hypothetical protein [Ostreibacterium oceani]MPV85970.1 hypothetical protein [Ostreibacterium oceani]
MIDWITAGVLLVSIVALVISPWLHIESKRLERRLEIRFQLYDKIFEYNDFYFSLREHLCYMSKLDMNKHTSWESEVKFLLRLAGNEKDKELYDKFVGAHGNYVDYLSGILEMYGYEFPPGISGDTHFENQHLLEEILRALDSLIEHCVAEHKQETKTFWKRWFAWKE